MLEQDPLDKRKRTMDFSDYLGLSTIASAAWVVPSALTESDASVTTTSAINYIEGGSDGEEHEIAVTITTNDAVARKKTQRFVLRITTQASADADLT